MDRGNPSFDYLLTNPSKFIIDLIFIDATVSNSKGGLEEKKKNFLENTLNSPTLHSIIRKIT